jgi:hypothetical protein
VIRFLRSFRAWALLLILAGLAYWLERQSSETLTGAAIHVIDGDSLRMDGRENPPGGHRRARIPPDLHRRGRRPLALRQGSARRARAAGRRRRFL